MPDTSPSRRARRRPRLQDWLDSLAPADRARAERWFTEAGPEAFDRIHGAYTDAPRPKGRTEVDDTRLLQEMAHLLVQHPGWRPHRAARHVAERVIAENDWGDRPIRAAAHSLCEKLKRDFAERSAELMQKARAKAQRHEDPRAAIPTVPASTAGPFPWQRVEFGRVSALEQSIRDAVGSAQLAAERLPRWLRDEAMMPRPAILSAMLEDAAKPRATTAEPWKPRIVEELDRLGRDPGLMNPPPWPPPV